MKTVTFYNNSPLSGNKFCSQSTKSAQFATEKITETIKVSMPGSAVAMWFIQGNIPSL